MPIFDKENLAYVADILIHIYEKSKKNVLKIRVSDIDLHKRLQKWNYDPEIIFEILTKLLSDGVIAKYNSRYLPDLCSDVGNDPNEDLVIFKVTLNPSSIPALRSLAESTSSATRNERIKVTEEGNSTIVRIGDKPPKTFKKMRARLITFFHNKRTDHEWRDYDRIKIEADIPNLTSVIGDAIDGINERVAVNLIISRTKSGTHLDHKEYKWG